MEKRTNHNEPNLDLVAEGLARALGDQFGVDLKIWFTPEKEAESTPREHQEGAG